MLYDPLCYLPRFVFFFLFYSGNSISMFAKNRSSLFMLLLLINGGGEDPQTTGEMRWG